MRHGQIESFGQRLSKHGLTLSREKTTTLQINVGFRCNQTCLHCHLSAGPNRTENMSADTVDDVVSYAKRARFETVDITGGAPELNPNLVTLIEKMSPISQGTILRTNLSVLNDEKNESLLDRLKALRVVMVASFPSLNESQLNAQRGNGIFQESIQALKRLNSMGYGHMGSGLELNIISNPAGAFLSPSQVHMEKRFREVLANKWGIVFNNLFNFANAPLGRFRQWLLHTGNLEKYQEKLASSFNPCAVDGVMCRSLVSVSWDGYLYDCDFNLAGGIYMGGKRVHVTNMPGPPEPGSPIAVADHCYTCTAGAGFT